MKRKRNNRGFTMAEMLIVVAIITVLASVGFIAVQAHQKSMAQLEANAVAKELFIAAQNHLTAAESQGYLSESIDYGTEQTDAKGVYYFSVPGGKFDGTVLGLMLPFGAIDETVRAGGNYVVRYQANPALVLDVFYGANTGRYAVNPISKGLDALLGGRESRNFGNDVIGWYGGAETQQTGKALKAPTITVKNAERLTVTVDASKVNVGDDNKPIFDDTEAVSLKLFITNADESVMAAIPLSVYTAKRAGGSLAKSSEQRVIKGQDESGAAKEGFFTVVLDDVTAPNLHFADINTEANVDRLDNHLFKPGEDITVYAVAYSNTELCNIVTSNAITVNSLFADYDIEKTTAYIANFRHLENLDGAVSGLGTGTGTEYITVNTAEQIVDLGKLPESEDGASGSGSGEGSGASGGETGGSGSGSGTGTTPAAEKDLSWTGFVAAIKAANNTTTVQIYTLAKTGETQTATANGKYRPVSPSYALTYKGNDHSITNVSATGAVADGTGAAGLFGAPTGTPTDSQPWALAVSDLVLYDFDISGSDAGALAGTLPAGSSVSNVLAYHGATETGKTVTGTGSAGGLVGSMAGGTVTQSAAAMRVSSTGTTGTVAAGGLIGAAANVAVTDSYSGGHTVSGAYSTTDYNVSAASGTAGGLIGAASGTTSVEYCYSTCSASGKVAGGLIGAAALSGETATVSASNSYAIGKAVGGTGEGAATGTFLGSGGLAGRGNLDFVYAVDMDSDDLMMPVELDGAWKIRTLAAPYDTTLGEKYIYPTVCQLHQMKLAADATYDTSVLPAHLTTHYGDWAEIQLFSDVNLTLINRERLSAKVTLPKAQIADGGKITMLIHGDTSGQDAYLVLKVTKASDNTYALSLSPESTVPGVTATAENPNALDAWLDKLKKKSVGIQFTDSDDAEIELNLDDITAPGGHFANLFNTFIPGENISVAIKGGVVTQDKLNTIVADTTGDKWKETKTVDGVSKQYVIAARTNSLFADPKTADKLDGTNLDTLAQAGAAIANFRHLENLSTDISGVNAVTTTLKYTHAKQIADLCADQTYEDGTTAADLSWSGFITAIVNSRANTSGTDVDKTIVVYKKDETQGQAGCFLPVDVPNPLVYDGGYTKREGENNVSKSHSISLVKVDATGNAGLFGTLPAGSSVSNLELIDFDITGTTAAGALAGESGANITNVLAHNSAEKGSVLTPTVVAATGSAGGLVGSMTGGKVEHSAAALVVQGGSEAGGLIGKASGGEVKGSYSGGRTSGGAYDSEHYNVIAASAGKAGGLIGDAGSATVTSCYSTCSASGGTAGGLVGNATGTVSNCYATGLVNGTTKGAFAGSIGSATGCLYFEVVNPGMSAAGNNATADITELDADLKTYKAFVGTAWTDAQPYDAKLARDYGNKYNLKSIGRLDTATPLAAGTFVATHYGDWPMPGTQVNNSK